MSNDGRGGYRSKRSPHKAFVGAPQIPASALEVRPPEVRARATFKPTGNLVSLQRLEQENPAGLILPTNGQAGEDLRTPVLLVIDVGPDCKKVSVGDQVLPGVSYVYTSQGPVPKLTFFVVEHAGQKVLVDSEDNLCGVVYGPYRLPDPPEAAVVPDKAPGTPAEPVNLELPAQDEAA